MKELEPEPEEGAAGFNPLRWPPCACARCRARPEGDGAADSSVIRRIRAGVCEENGLRDSLRRTR
ncbi:hypothetical protein ACFVWY_26995 [Streptomyces sp. NPDC058195]|uniref:hypothetical protein n=1 Tax=Streptomyces sp. NPDC058195 TaxID=3346375 RepID=UPI0036E7A78C